MDGGRVDSVLLPESILSAPTPSAKDGVSAAVERAHRSWGCLLACEAGVLLQLPQVVQATAQNLLQRFYWRKSLKDPRFDAFTVAMTCVFLATKIEETPRKLRYVLYAFHPSYPLVVSSICDSASHLPKCVKFFYR